MAFQITIGHHKNNQLSQESPKDSKAYESKFEEKLGR